MKGMISMKRFVLLTYLRITFIALTGLFVAAWVAGDPSHCHTHENEGSAWTPEKQQSPQNANDTATTPQSGNPQATSEKSTDTAGPQAVNGDRPTEAAPTAPNPKPTQNATEPEECSRVLNKWCVNV